MRDDPYDAPGADLATFGTAPVAVSRRRNSHTALPALAGAVAVAAGAALRTRVPVAAVIVAAVVAVLLVQRWVDRRNMFPDDRNSVVQGAAVIAAFVAVTATGPLTPITGAVFIGIVAVATARIRRHPHFLRKQDLRDLADWFPAVAASAGEPHLRLNGPVVDRAPDGYTYRVRVPRGMTVDHLSHRTAQFTSALGLRRGDLQIEIDPDYHHLAKIHVTEHDPHADPTAVQLDPDVKSIRDPLPIALYDDGTPFNLRLFEPDVGGLDTLAAGDKGSGKSSFLVRLLRILVKLPDVAIVALDGANGRDLGPWEGCFARYVTSHRDAYTQARLLRDAVDQREHVMRANGWRVWPASAAHPVIVVIVEEMKLYATGEYGAEISECFEHIATCNRATGIVVIGVTQYPRDRNVFGVGVRRGMANRFGFHTNESGNLALNTAVDTSTIPKKLAGTFYAETYEEERAMRGRVIWTTNADRLATIKEWAGKQASIDDEWATLERAQQDRRRGPETPHQRAEEHPDVSDDGVIEGVYTVQSVKFPPIRDAAPKRREMTFELADETFRALLDERGAQGVTRKEIEDLTGWRRTRVRDLLLNPATDAGWVKIVARGRERVYVSDKAHVAV